MDSQIRTPVVSPAGSQARAGRGLTIVEVVVALVVIVLVLGVLMVILPSIGRRPHGGRQLKDATQIRYIVQAALIFSQSNHEQFPLPSAIDLKNTTVAADGRAKDTTANIMSVLIWNGAISPEVTVSPAEANERIVINEQYEPHHPTAAVNPAEALWDPAFSADFTAGNKGNISFAMAETSGTPDAGRRKQWVNLFDPLLPVVGNRAPKLSRVTYDKNGRATPEVADAGTNTYLIHGGRKTWEGNIAYNDGHVDFLTSLSPAEMPSYATATGGKQQDCMFFDEPDDPSAGNAYLGIFLTAGEKPGDFHAIFD